MGDVLGEAGEVSGGCPEAAALEFVFTMLSSDGRAFKITALRQRAVKLEPTQALRGEN